jgi:para-nitrobenzyl esterase
MFVTPKGESKVEVVITTRRSFLSAVGAGAAFVTEPAAQPQAAATPGTNQQLFWTAETTYGRVQGIANTGIKEFKGIPYGATTGGKNRYMPPRKPLAWTGTRECLGAGPVCPQTLASLQNDYSMMIQWDQHAGVMSEDCLSLNVWTPGVNDGGRRPVMVSFHGGGFSSGSGNFLGYDGAQLARFGDVVVVTVNHRLASFGYLDLAGLGAAPEFASAGVAGMMDLAASLTWVRDNIERFGGDPARVMIFGQSGGGAKTSIMLAMPSVRGLFHTAAVQSGSIVRLGTREQTTKAAEALLAKLGISKRSIPDLQKLSWQQILEAQSSLDSSAVFTPVVDGNVLPHQPFDPIAPPESADVPLIVSTTLEDSALSLVNFDLDEKGLRTIMAQRYGEKAGPMLALYRARYPNKSPFLIEAQIATDVGLRRNAVLQAERKAASGKAPAYMYLWAFESPGFGGKFGAVHGIDVSASFYNYRDGIGGAGSSEQRAVWRSFASAWVALARTGNPSNPAIPEWPPYDSVRRATMIFEREIRVENDPRAEIRTFWNDSLPGPRPG